ncbi:hypothetical protein FDN13_04695 [Caloramator sp. E03]|uniref:hypothetical protein n=1 Tax=Caloramator sp. E03 TaxID=2576307 RepID=UPI0011101F35|nr:hypothetical protein [Caloramator sp. E03]QCX33065.1 hypothetical protein FDN13_04695 [Caloramator sp. E03]
MMESEIHQFLKLISNININPYANNLKLKQDDERIKILNTLKDFLPDDKKFIIDDIINTFSSIGETNSLKSASDNTETFNQSENSQS